MPDQTAAQIFGNLTGEEIYNRIMAGIEPDLVTSARDTLDAKYKDETPEQKQARLARYNKAFEEYERQHAKYMEDLSSKAQKLQRDIRQGFEADARKSDATGLSNIESAMSAA